MVTSTALDTKQVVLSQYEISKEIYESGLLSKYEMTAGSKLMLIGLANHYNPKKPDMYPSQKHLEAKLGVSERTIRRAAQELKQLDLIDYENKKVHHYKFTAKFFAEVKMSYQSGQIVRLKQDKMSDKQIHEHKNNNNGNLVNFPKPQTYRHDTAVKGIEYKSPEQTVADYEESVKTENSKNPWNDKESAVLYIENVKPLMDKREIRERVEQIQKLWNLQEKAVDSGQNVQSSNTSHYLLY